MPGAKERLPIQQEEMLNKIIAKAPKTTERGLRIFCDFGLNNNGGERADLKDLLLEKGLADLPPYRIPRERLWEIKSERAFDVSPRGWGQDCYRTWESLALGCIVIVKTSFLDPLFEGLSVVIVKEWDEITEEKLQAWLLQYGDVFHDSQVREKITHKYWMDKILQVQQSYRRGGQSV